MAYRRATGNIRKPRRSVRRRAPARRRAVTRRRTYRRRAPRRAVKSGPTELTPSTKFALAQLDPFEPMCLGAKVPDSNTFPSIANCDVDLVSLAGPPSVNPQYLVGIAFCPQYYTATITGTAGNSLTWDGAFTSRSKITAVTNSVEAVRPVAHAIRISSPLAPTSTTGFVHIGLAVESRVSSGAAANIDLPKTIADMSGLAHYKRVTLASLTQSPITVINKWIDETGFRYDDPRTAQTFSSNSTVPTTQTFNFNTSWATIVVIIEGGPVTATNLSCEHLLMTEMLPRKDAFILGNAAAPNSPGLMGATSAMVADQDFAHTEAEQESYIGRGISNMVQGLYQQGERVFAENAPALAQRAQNYVTSTATNYMLGALGGLLGIGGVNSNPNRLMLTGA